MVDRIHIIAKMEQVRTAKTVGETLIDALPGGRNGHKKKESHTYISLKYQYARSTQIEINQPQSSRSHAKLLREQNINVTMCGKSKGPITTMNFQRIRLLKSTRSTDPSRRSWKELTYTAAILYRSIHVRERVLLQTFAKLYRCDVGAP